jgi:hypothetical protein
MMPIDTIGEFALREHALRDAQAERGWQAEVAARAERRLVTPAAAERREPQPDPLGLVLVKLFNVVGAALARVGGQVADRRYGLHSHEHERAANCVTWVTVPADDER